MQCCDSLSEGMPSYALGYYLTMARAPKPGKCVHCLRGPLPLTWDHVFPKAWYPNDARVGIYKWQIPACKKCNAEYGALEDELLIKLGVCVDPEVAGASGILDKARAAIDPRAAKSARDRRMRQGRRDKLRSMALVGDQIPTTGIYPGMHERWGRPKSEQMAVKVPKRYFERLTEKIVRGIFWMRDKRFIEPPYKIDFFALDRAASMHDLKRGEVYAHEPGVRVTCLIVPDDGTTSAFEIEIWGTFKMHAFVGCE